MFLTKDSQEILFRFALDWRQTKSRHACARHDRKFAENIGSIMTTPNGLAEARASYRNAIGIIDSQIGAMILKIREAREAKNGTNQLMNRWMAVRSACLSLQPKGPTLQRY